MSVLYHHLYNNMAPSFEALMKEFVDDPLGLNPSQREHRRNAITAYFKKLYNSRSGDNTTRKRSSLIQSYKDTRRWAQDKFVQHHRRKRMKTNESAIDFPRDGLDKQIWNEHDGQWMLRSDVKWKILSFLKEYPNEDLIGLADKIHVVGSLGTNQYADDADIDVHIIPKFDALPSGKEAQEEMVQEIKKWSQQNPVYIGKHPMEIYLQLNPDQDMLGDSVFDLNANEWLKGPKFVDLGFDPYDAFKGVVDSVRDEAEEADLSIGELKRDVIDYNIIKTAIKRLPEENRGKLINRLQAKVQEVEDDIDELLKDKKEWVEARHGASKPASKEQAMQDLELSKKWQDTNAMFKFLDRYNYIWLISELEKLKRDDGEVSPSEMNTITGLLKSGG